jgi:hypothetical protein
MVRIDSYTKFLEPQRFEARPPPSRALSSAELPMHRKLLGFLAVLAAACGTPEAEDPHKLLGDDAQYQGVEGTNGARSEKESGSRAKPAAESGSIASQAECNAAALRIEELALDLAIKEEDDPNQRAQLEAKKQEELKSAAFKSRVGQGAKDCVARETTSREARCVAKARSEMEVDRCSSR